MREPMGIEDDISIRLSAQRALLGHVTPALRAVSVDVDPQSRRVSVRFVFDGEVSEAVRDAAACAGTEILSDYPDWDVDEQFLNVRAPLQIEHLRFVVYARCEDDWVKSHGGHSANE